MTASAPRRRLATVTLVVDDYDRAKAFYCDVLGFECLADSNLEGDKRWLVVTPKGGTGAALLLARADGEAQTQAIGNQTGGRAGSSWRLMTSHVITRSFSQMGSSSSKSLVARSTEQSPSLQTSSEIAGT